MPKRSPDTSTIDEVVEAKILGEFVAEGPVLIAYDLRKKKRRRLPIVPVIEELDPRYLKLSESSYVIVTSLTPRAVLERLETSGVVDNKDDVYVITLRGPWDGYGNPRVLARLGEILH